MKIDMEIRKFEITLSAPCFCSKFPCTYCLKFTLLSFGVTFSVRPPLFDVVSEKLKKTGPFAPSPSLLSWDTGDFLYGLS